MELISVDGVEIEVNELSFSPFPTEGLINEVRFRIADTPNRRLTEVNHYVPLEFSVGARRYEGLLRLVSSAQVRFATEYVYTGSARAVSGADAEASVPPPGASAG